MNLQKTNQLLEGVKCELSEAPIFDYGKMSRDALAKLADAAGELQDMVTHLQHAPEPFPRTAKQVEPLVDQIGKIHDRLNSILHGVRT